MNSAVYDVNSNMNSPYNPKITVPFFPPSLSDFQSPSTVFRRTIQRYSLDGVDGAMNVKY